MKRLVDIVFSFIGLILLSPLFLIISLLIFLTSKGGVFYCQKRVGKNDREFTLFKFRTMRLNADIHGRLTVGERDSRITTIGYYLRKYKLDELPQLINVFYGSMSIVGPRPEVREYVNLYNEEQKEILLLKPGLTDYASLEYFNENELLAHARDPNLAYVNEIMPAKIKLNQKYIKEKSLLTDFKIMIATIRKVFSS